MQFRINFSTFTLVCHDISTVLVLLGEIVLHFLAIPCLNYAHNKTNNWFYDVYTPCGISLDGFAPASKNTPNRILQPVGSIGRQS